MLGWVTFQKSKKVVLHLRGVSYPHEQCTCLPRPPSLPQCLQLAREQQGNVESEIFGSPQCLQLARHGSNTKM